MTKLVRLLMTSVFQRDTGSNQLRERVLDRAFERIWKQVVGRVLEMPAAEARGYVRARAAAIVRDALAAECGGRQAAVYAPVMDAAVQRVLARARTVRAQEALRRAA